MLCYKIFPLFFRQTLYISQTAFFTSKKYFRLNSESGSTIFRNLCRLLYRFGDSTNNRATRCQFHHHFTYEFFSYKRHFGSFFYVHVTREKLPKRRSYEKFVRKMLMKLTTGITFWSSGLSVQSTENGKLHFA